MKFLDREKEIQDAEIFIDSFNLGSNIDYHIREYNGIGGIGKSALLTELMKLGKEKNVIALFFDLGAFSSIDYRDLLDRLSRSAIAQIESDYNLSIDDNEFDRGALLSVIDHLSSKGHKIVFLLDTVDRVSETNLEVLSREIILPVIEKKQAVFFVASRQRINWGSSRYKVGRRTITKQLELFSAENAKLKLNDLQLTEFVDDIMTVTCGHPGSIDLVADLINDIQHVENIKIRDENFGDYEKRLIGAVLDNVKRDNLVPLDQFNALYVLSVLRYVEVTIPSILLMSIDKDKEWDRKSVLDLLSSLQKDESIFKWQVASQRYEINEFIRRLFSLHMRVYFPGQYLKLTRAAANHYVNKFNESLNSAEPDIDSLVEKIYHYSDVYRLTSTNKFDIQVANDLRKMLLNDLEIAIPGGGLVFSNVSYHNNLRNFDMRLRALEALKQKLRVDNELHEKLGDLETPEPDKYLLQIVTNYERDFLSADHAILDIVQAKSGITGGQPSDDQECVAAFITRRSEPITTTNFKISKDDRKRIIGQLQKRVSVDNVKTLGSWLFQKYIRDEVLQLVQEHVSLKSPLTLSVDDTEIPWELMFDSATNDFLALKLPLGKRFRTSEPFRSWANTTRPANRCLLVGVPHTNLAGYEPLHHIENEIERLKNIFSSWDGIDFNPATDILFDDDAIAFEFETRLVTGNYKIIHFAGHAYYEISGPGSYSKAGLVMKDRIMDLDDIKSMKKGGRPLIFLNACQSAFEKNERTELGYAGSYSLGIASAFILSGAVACVGNIWPVVDDKAAIFAEYFYGELRRGKSLGEALRAAKELYRAENPPDDFPNDLTWLSYVLYGDPTQKILMSNI